MWGARICLDESKWEVPLMAGVQYPCRVLQVAVIKVPVYGAHDCVGKMPVQDVLGRAPFHYYFR